jgi:hypothetical protein
MSAVVETLEEIDFSKLRGKELEGAIENERARIKEEQAAKEAKAAARLEAIAGMGGADDLPAVTNPDFAALEPYDPGTPGTPGTPKALGESKSKRAEKKRERKDLSLRNSRTSSTRCTRVNPAIESLDKKLESERHKREWLVLGFIKNHPGCTLTEIAKSSRRFDRETVRKYLHGHTGRYPGLIAEGKVRVKRAIGKPNLYYAIEEAS